MGVDSNLPLQFGDFELDILSGELRRGGRPIKIQPQPLRVLTALVEQPGQIVSREDLRARIWGTSTFVEFDQGLNYCIRQIRLALGDEASEPIYIETLPKQGYRFIAPIAANGHIAEIPPLGAVAPVPSPPPKKPHWKILGAAIALIAFVGAGALFRITQPSAARQPAAYTQITSFTDAAVTPVLSPDGRMVAFYRSDREFFTSDQIYAKMLPDGEPVQLTHDPRLKYNLAFSPDSSRIAYTVMENGWHTYTVSSLGGDSTLFLPNSAGLTWLDQHRLLFSEIKTGVHMGIVTANEDRSQHREIYFPVRERAMAHYSYASPDRKWALVVEMDPQWQPCRLIPLAGGSLGKQVGPSGACTSAAWSPHGSWMYFGVEVQGRRHLWRQSFPDGQPEQITSGPTEEDGVAVAPGGRSLITSISTKQNAVWIHDSHGDHALSTEGYAAATPPLFSHDGKSLYSSAAARLARVAQRTLACRSRLRPQRSGSARSFYPPIRHFEATKKRLCFPPACGASLPTLAGSLGQEFGAAHDFGKRRSQSAFWSERPSAFPLHGWKRVLSRQDGTGWVPPYEAFPVPDPRLLWNISGPPLRARERSR